MIIKTKKKDYLWSYLAYILKFGVNLFLFPLVLKMLSQEEYGLWVTFTSLGTIVNIFDFGFSSTLLRNMTYTWSGASNLQAEGFTSTDDKSERNDRLFVLTFHTCRVIYLVIAIIAVIMSYSVGLLYIKYVIRDIYRLEYIIAWFIYGAGISINLYYAYWGVSLKSVGAIEQTQKATVFGFLVQIVISYVGLIVGGGIIAISLSSCVSGVIIRVLSKRKFMKFQNIGVIFKGNYDITKREITELFKILWHNAKRAGISTIATVSITQSTTILSSAFFGVTITGEYGLCMQLINIISGVSQIQYQTNLPQITQSRLMKNLKRCQSLFASSVILSWLIYLVGVIAVIFIGKPILNLIQSQTVLNIPIFIFVALYTFGEMNYSMHASYISLENKLPFVPSVVISAIIIIILSFVSIKASFGIWGIMITRFAVQAAYVFWKWPYVALKQLQMSTGRIIQIGFQEWIQIIMSQLGILKKME